MALSNFRKEKLRQLEIGRGGVAFATRKSSETPTPTVVISLGGLGAQTINTLKGKFKKDIGQSKNVWFRMIDTDTRTFDNFNKVRADGTNNSLPDANMESGETISLYDPALAHILAPATVPGYIKEWLNPELIGRVIDGRGAQQTRQIGRVMLICESVYEVVRQKLYTILNDAVNTADGKPIDVILIAGVSGGTGSGTVIDISYMVHDLLNAFGCTNYSLAGYIFTPDAQFTVPDISKNHVIMTNLKRNGYSALKEIDYFMNIEETNSTYKLKLPRRDVVSTKNIFSSCTLVSGYNEMGGLRQTSDIIECLTDQIMDMLTDIKVTERGVVRQMSNSIMSNDHAFIGTWFVGHPDRRLYHRYASYKYQILGYNSIRIPKDEIFAYCVDRIYEGVLEEFKNFRNVNRKMLSEVYNASHTSNPAELATYAERFGGINREISLPGYTKQVVKNNSMIAYDDAIEVAKEQAAKINGVFKSRLENDLYETLKNQIDQIFDQYGPYMAMRAIQHEAVCLTDGDPNEPFSGVCEQLDRLSKAMDQKAAQCMKSTDRMEEIQEKADTASRFFGKAADMTAYISECCTQAAIKCIDPVFFDALSKVLRNVSTRMNDYNTELFSVYTEILDVVQEILSKDGDYFTRGQREFAGSSELYSVDIIKSGKERTDRLRKYLDAFIAEVSVHQLVQNFIKQMRGNKEKWLAQKSENNFDVVTEVRALMDNCLTNNDMIPQIIEKFVVVAYHPDELTPNQLDDIWSDDTPDGKKISALNAAAQHILNTLESGARAMANSAGVIPLNTYGSHYFISALEDTPNLTRILGNLVNQMNNTTIAISNSRNKFIYTRQYYDVPMYILRGMDDYNEIYVTQPSPGRHMDESNQGWNRFQNPYTIDSVSLDIQRKGLHQDLIKSYPDMIILDKVKSQTQAGFDIGYVKKENRTALTGGLILYDVTNLPVDMEKFKVELEQAAFDMIAEDKPFDLIWFMEHHGFTIKPVSVFTGDTDVDLGLTDFNDASQNDKLMKYNNLPVPVEDVYKWLRKSAYYMDILERDYKLFKDLNSIVFKASQDVEKMQKYKENIKTFAFALRTGGIRHDLKDPDKWEYMEGDKPVLVDMDLRNKFDKQFFLYHVFVEFQKMDADLMEEVKEQADRKYKMGERYSDRERDYINSHIEEMLGDSYFGDRFNARTINRDAQELSDSNSYLVTDEKENVGNPFHVLKRFYTRLSANL